MFFFLEVDVEFKKMTEVKNTGNIATALKFV